MRAVIPVMVGIGLVALFLAGCSTAREVSSEQQACTLATARVVEVNRFPTAHVAACDPVMASDTPGYYVLALQSDRRCEDICSTNLGWYAIRRSDGEVFDWDVGESRLGPPVRD